jgi:hypothetical protein
VSIFEHDRVDMKVRLTHKVSIEFRGIVLWTGTISKRGLLAAQVAYRVAMGDDRGSLTLFCFCPVKPTLSGGRWYDYIARSNLRLVTVYIRERSTTYASHLIYYRKDRTVLAIQ